ncbi:MAG: PAS domain S-box protein [Candidatus Sumerlaeota bacterium]|nr:PAS domain S-box protein [Candidatus Sumerlaeota bacterium]
MRTDSLKILLVEDNPDDVKLIQMALAEDEEGKYQIRHADRLSAATALMKSENFGFIFLDLNLPDSMGLQTVTKVCESAPEVPIVVLTGIDDMEAAVASLRYGAQDYILKSDISAPMLKRAINYAIERKRHMEILAQAQNKLSSLLQERTNEARHVHVHLQEAMQDRIKAAQAIADTRYYFETLIQASLDGILTIDAHGRFEFGNQACFDILGWPPRELIGEHFLKVIPLDLHPFILERWKEVQQGKGRPYEVDIVRKTGERRSLLVSQRHMTVSSERKYCVVIKDVTESKRQQSAILKAKQEWEQTFDAAPDLIMILNREYQIQRANKAVADRIGIPVKSLIGKPCYSAVHGEDKPVCGCPHAQSLASGNEGQAAAWIDKLNGHFNITASPIHDENGQVNGVVHVARDVTQLMQTEKELRNAAAELQMRNQELDAFAHTVAHDLKNPVSKTLTAASILLKKDASLSRKNVKRLLDIIARNSRQSANIIDELLMLAEMRMADVTMRPLDMTQLVLEAQDRLEYMVKQYQGNVALPDAFPMAIGYGPWIEEVWCNLISNALKYGGSPPQVEVGASDETDDMIAFWVRDNGQSLKPEDCSKLFKPFSRLNKIRAQGHGLGLSIVKRIVEKHCGQVGVRIHPNRGNVFYFTLPRYKPENPACQVIEARQAAEDSSQI